MARPIKILVAVFVTQLSMFAIAIMPSQEAKDKPIRLCGIENGPFIQVAETKSKEITGGVTIDVITEAMKRMGRTVRFDYVPWERCLSDVKEDQRDGVLNAVQSRRNDGYIVGTRPTAPWPLAFWVNQDSRLLTWKSFDDLKGLKVGMVRGFKYSDKVLGYRGWKRDLALSEAVNLQKLVAHRIDVAIVDLYIAEETAKKFGLKLRQLEPLVSTDPLFLVFSPKKKELAKEFDETLAKMQKDGTLNKIYKAKINKSYSELLQDEYK